MGTDVRVCFVGDSLTLGVGDPAAYGWAGRLVTEHTPGDISLTSYNLGVRGETSTDVAARWRAEVTPRLAGRRHRGVVLSVGVNDTRGEHGPAVGIDESVATLSGLINEAGSLSLPLLVVGPVPVADAEHNERTRALDARFAEVCAGGGVDYVPVFTRLIADPIWLGQVSAVDGLHPQHAGYGLLAGLIAPAWQGWLGRVRHHEGQHRR